MPKCKYIIIDKGLPLPVLFSELMTHSDVARDMHALENVVGAGFCYIIDNQYVCYGESISLKVKSRNEVDSKILNKLLGTSE